MHDMSRAQRSRWGHANTATTQSLNINSGWMPVAGGAAAASQSPMADPPAQTQTQTQTQTATSSFSANIGGVSSSTSTSSHHQSRPHHISWQRGGVVNDNGDSKSSQSTASGNVSSSSLSRSSPSPPLSSSSALPSSLSDAALAVAAASAARRAARLADVERMDEESDAFHAYKAARILEGDGNDESIDRHPGLDVPLPPSNIGHRLLLKMGWGGIGTGLGKTGRGIAEPIRLDFETGQLGYGLGKRKEYEEQAEAATRERKKMEAEAQSEETEAQRTARIEAAAAAARTAAHVAASIASLRCDACNKQYTRATEYETHLSSYDHHHVMRMRETKRAENARKLTQSHVQTAAKSSDASPMTESNGTDAVPDKEARRALKEEQRMEAQRQAAEALMRERQQASSATSFNPASGAMTPAATSTPSSTPAPFTGMKVGFGLAMKKKPTVLGLAAKKPAMGKFSFSLDE